MVTKWGILKGASEWLLPWLPAFEAGPDIIGSVPNLAYRLGFAIVRMILFNNNTKIPIAISFLLDSIDCRCSHFDGKTKILDRAYIIRKFINIARTIFIMVGNLPNFSHIDVLRCFLKFSKNTGRHELAKELGLGEGTVRTILDILKKKGMLGSTKKGHFLSSKGIAILDKISGCITAPKEAHSGSIYQEFKKSGVIVRGAGMPKEVYKLRDTAVKSGAEGAIILKFDGRLKAPEYESVDFSEMEKSFDMESGDLLVISFSGDRRHAENGALAIAAELSSFLKKFIKELE